VDVLVTRGGHPVTDLKPEDFEIQDNGMPQRIDAYGAFEEIPLNLVLALDASSSVAGKRAELLRGASRALLDELRAGDQAGLVVFGDAVVVQSRLTPDLASVKAAIDRPLPPGMTSLADAAQASMALAESAAGRALVLLFTDGLEVSSYLPASVVIETAQRSDAVVYGVTPRRVQVRRLMADLTEASGGAVREIESPEEIGPTFRSVLDEFRRRYVLSYTPTDQGAGWHKLRVRVKPPGLTVKARPGYFR
jgi:Ca-activated chloride channel homolog